MRVAHFDPVAGASGDMILGALVDAGLPLDQLRADLAALPLLGYQLDAKPDRRGALGGTRVSVRLTDSEPLPHRHLADVLAIIEAAPALPGPIRAQARAVFERLAAAEAQVHGVAVEAVEFHEVGAVDALVDVVGAVAGLARLGVEQVTCGPLPFGGGLVRHQHGLLPVPAPATLALLADVKAPLRPSPPGGEAMELVTPTGAAILATVAQFGPPPALRLERVGHGLGQRALDPLPNVLRLWLGTDDSSATARQEDVFDATLAVNEMVMLETNLDDMTPEWLGYVMERLFGAGARDVWFTPIQMKKNRPGVLLSVLAPLEREAVLVSLLFRESSTLGVRAYRVRRWETERETRLVRTSLGEVRVKLKRLAGAVVAVSPEFVDCAQLASAQGLPLPDVYRRVEGEARSQLGLPPWLPGITESERS